MDFYRGEILTRVRRIDYLRFESLRITPYHITYYGVSHISATSDDQNHLDIDVIENISTLGLFLNRRMVYYFMGQGKRVVGSLGKPLPPPLDVRNTRGVTNAVPDF